MPNSVVNPDSSLIGYVSNNGLRTIVRKMAEENNTKGLFSLLDHLDEGEFAAAVGRQENMFIAQNMSKGKENVIRFISVITDSRDILLDIDNSRLDVETNIYRAFNYLTINNLEVKKIELRRFLTDGVFIMEIMV